MDKEYVRLLEALATAAKKSGAQSLPYLVLQALRHLELYRPASPADTVPLRINYWVNKESGEKCVILEKDDDPDEYNNAYWRHVAIITAHVPASPPAVPVIEGECKA